MIDQFTPPKNFYDYIKESKEQIKNVTFMTKAEDQVISVAAASVISRYIFLGKIKEIENSLGISIPLGASNLVDEAGVKIVKKFGIPAAESVYSLIRVADCADITVLRYEKFD